MSIMSEQLFELAFLALVRLGLTCRRRQVSPLNSTVMICLQSTRWGCDAQIGLLMIRRSTLIRRGLLLNTILEGRLGGRLGRRLEPAQYVRTNPNWACRGPESDKKHIRMAMTLSPQYGQGCCQTCLGCATWYSHYCAYIHMSSCKSAKQDSALWICNLPSKHITIAFFNGL